MFLGRISKASHTPRFPISPPAPRAHTLPTTYFARIAAQTTRLGKWGYCDCNGANPLGLEWKAANWTKCSKTCGTGVKTRVVNCVNSTTGDVLDNRALCGESPATYEICNDHDCDEGCDIPHNERKISEGFYADPLNKVAPFLVVLPTGSVPLHHRRRSARCS